MWFTLTISYDKILNNSNKNKLIFLIEFTRFSLLLLSVRKFRVIPTRMRSDPEIIRKFYSFAICLRLQFLLFYCFNFFVDMTIETWIDAVITIKTKQKKTRKELAKLLAICCYRFNDTLYSDWPFAIHWMFPRAKIIIVWYMFRVPITTPRPTP